MAKGQMRSNKEARKPKADKKAKGAAAEAPKSGRVGGRIPPRGAPGGAVFNLLGVLQALRSLGQRETAAGGTGRAL